MAAVANSWLPVSTSTRPSSVATALTLANDGTKAQPSATWATSPRGANGCASSMAISPRHNRSATSRTSSAMRVAGWLDLDLVDFVEHQGPRHVDPEEHDQRKQYRLDPDGRAEVLGRAGGQGDEDDERVQDDGHRRLELPQSPSRRRDRRELDVAQDDGARRPRQRERDAPHCRVGWVDQSEQAHQSGKGEVQRDGVRPAPVGGTAPPVCVAGLHDDQPEAVDGEAQGCEGG